MEPAVVGRCAWGVLAVALVSGCGSGSRTGEATMSEDLGVPRTITVTSEAFVEGGSIPRRHTCDGDGTSPPLSWSGVPSGTGAVALVVDDPDAPSGTFTHWVVLDVPPGTSSLREGAAPPGAQARNSAGAAAWMGPCPPRGTHHYRFTVVALRAATGLRDGAALGTALEAIRREALAQGRLTATYTRGR